MVWGDSGEKLGGIVSLSYKTGNQFVEEERNFYKVSRDAIALQNEYDFKQLDLSEEEFRLHVWPELPGSQLK